MSNSIFAEQFIREGASVVLCARNAKELAATRDELAKLAGARQKIVAETCDVSSEAQVNELVSFSLAELGSLQALVLNAGIFPVVPFEQTSLELWERTLAINLTGSFLAARRALPGTRPSRGSAPR